MTKSIYDQLNASGTVAKQRFVEDFSGWQLDTDRWATHGSGSHNMSDSNDGGLALTSPTSGHHQIDFAPSDAGKIRQFSPTGAVMIVVSKLQQKQYSINYSGLRSMYYTEGGTAGYWSVQGQTNGNSGDNKIRVYPNGASNIDTSVPSSEIHDRHTFKLELTATNTSLSVDGVLSGNGFVSAVGVPTAQCQPYLYSGTAENPSPVSGGCTTNYTYCEVYNT